MAGFDYNRPIIRQRCNLEGIPKQKVDFGWINGILNNEQTPHKRARDATLETILDICRDPPAMPDMELTRNAECIFMILPFKYNSSRSNRETWPINHQSGYRDRWDTDHVRMPCSPKYIFESKNSGWLGICQWLRDLRSKCQNRTATVQDLKTTIRNCSQRYYDMKSLEILINQNYSKPERDHFMSIVLSNMCSLALHVDDICSEPPPLLRIYSERSVTMSQHQAASLLACAFFCLFPYRSEHNQRKEYENFSNPNFNRLYELGPAEKIEKLKCILHYFHRITKQKPLGVISFQRYNLFRKNYPRWFRSKGELSQLHITTDKKIEDINCVLQVDFANKFIGGGILGNGCVQEEIRFSLCPEMLVSLLICEVMEPDECVFLIGCERYSTYKGYAESFQFLGNYEDQTPKDNWGRRWSHLVAIDAVYFRDRTAQYEMEYVTRELIKAYAAFRPRPSSTGAENLFAIATGNWGCGVFNGDKEMKGIIQLMAASEAQRPLIYAAYLDKHFAKSFSKIYDCLKQQKATVGDLYRYLEQYSTRSTRESLFDYILHHCISSYQ